jgi:hypothetical protein
MSDFAVTLIRTPNPNSIKFQTTKTLHDGPAAAFYSAQQAEDHPVARQLFALPGVTGVMILNDFCSVNKQEDVDWEDLAPRVEHVLTAAYG